MKNRIVWMVFLSVFFLMVLPMGTYAQYCIQGLKQGKIDWSNGIVEAVGRGCPPKYPENLAQARAVAEAEAAIIARRNLLAVIEAIRVDSGTNIKELMAESETIRESVQSFIKHAPLAEVTYMEDGSVRATVTVELRGAFADSILPESIRTIKPVRQPKAAGKEKEPGYTGLIIDCRGFQVKSAMAPLVTDEDGREVYGPAFVSRKHAVEISMAGYARDLETARNCQRVCGNPLVIKGIRTAGNGVSDVVISNADAGEIRGTPSHLVLLQQCRIVFVID